MANYNRYTLGELIDQLSQRLGENSTFWVHDEKRDSINEALNVWQLMVGEFTTGITMAANGGTFYSVPTQLGAIQRVKFQSPSTTTIIPSTLNNGIVSFWNLGEASGAIRADSAGVNNLTNNNGVTQVAGKLGNASGFDPALSQTLNVADNASLQFNTQQTIAGWIYWNDIIGAQITFFNKYVFGGAFSYDFRLVRSGVGTAYLMFIIPSDATAQTPRGDTIGSGIITSNTWMHVAAVFDGSGSTNSDRLKIYINGVPSTLTFFGTIPSQIPLSVADIVFGNWPGQSRYWDGRLDAFGLWSRALSSSEISLLYNGGVGVEYLFPNLGSTTTTFPEKSLTLSSINELDLGSPGWQGVRDDPQFYALMGTNLLALSPQPLTGTISIEGISETPTLTNDSDYVMLGDEVLNRILDYAEHYCSFKEGVGEFDAQQTGFGLFIEAAGKRNGALLASALYREWMGRNREEQGRYSELPSPPVAR